MKTDGPKLFRMISMLLVVTAMAAALSLAGLSEVRFWTLLGIISAVSIIYLMLFRRYEKRLEEYDSFLQSKADLKDSIRAYAMMILIDGYDDRFSDMTDSDKAEITIKIDKFCTKAIESQNGIIKKLSPDRYFCILSSGGIEALRNEEFKSIIEGVHRITDNKKRPITLSVGVGQGGRSLADSEKMARNALTMTQGRGGDQAIVMTDEKPVCYGGVSISAEKESKVRIRSFSQALYEAIRKSDNVMIMGHKTSDLDSIGSSVGLCGAIRCLNCEKNAYVYVNTENTVALALYDRLNSRLKNENIFVSEDKAKELITDDTLLIVTDTSKVNQMDSEELYGRAKKVVYIDHHIQDENCIRTEMQSFRDDQASSASEIVTEVISYFRDNMNKEFSNYYAEALLSGIYLDTKDFVINTGVRTFEAAAYLKKLGADTVAVKQMFAISMNMGKRRSELISNAQIYKGFAISLYSAPIKDGVPAEEPISVVKVISSQAADALLNIKNVGGSFVIYPERRDTDGYSISARSYKVNIANIVQKLHGGGHQISAGAWIKEKTMEEVKQMLLEAIDDFESGDK